MDGARREEEEGGALWSVDDILWVTLGVLALARPQPGLLVTCTPHPSMMDSPESLDQVKFPS